jgi:protocatechuate 3,4-dioxygenase beta subunit
VPAGEDWFEDAQRISGTVVDGAGRPMAGVRVRAEPAGFRGVTLEDTTGEAGRFCLLGLRPGPHHVTAEAPGLPPVRRRHVHCGVTDREREQKSPASRAGTRREQRKERGGLDLAEPVEDDERRSDAKRIAPGPEGCRPRRAKVL